jgi:isopenicillin N synthase-like dioxygenase
MIKVPKINLENFVLGSKKEKNKFIKDIGKAFEEIGFVALKGHFLDKNLVDKLYTEVNSFFNLPIETKIKYEIKGLNGQRGYTSFGKEHAKGRSVGDLKEFWHFGQETKNENILNKKYSANLKVNEIPMFNKVGMTSYKMLEKTGKEILRALSIYLNLDEFYFDKYIFNGNSILRAIHYPPIKNKPENAERAAPHGDINLITLLMGAQGKGLQLKTNDGSWIDAIAESDELMINIGDMLSRLTNNKLKSTIHRVTNPPKKMWGKSRFSIPFFMHPVDEMPLNCLESCINQNNPKNFNDISAGEFLNKRLIEIGLKKNK